MKTLILEKGSEERNKKIALIKYWKEQGNNPKEVVDYDGNKEYGDYLILTEEEADEMTKEYILDSVWAFNKSFLNQHSEVISEIDDKSFAKIQEGCESVNKAFIKMIDDIDYFIEDAINTDGRGHFLSHYDGEENEVVVDSKSYFIYRVG
jgi:hypothetical protein